MHPLIETHRAALLALARARGITDVRVFGSIRVLLAHMREGLDRIAECSGADRARFDASRLVQDAVIRNLLTLTESSQRLSAGIKATEPEIPWRELAGFRNVIVHGYLGVDLGAIWLVVEQDALAVSRKPQPPPAAPATTRTPASPGSRPRPG